MKCPKCGYENREGTAFCGGCFQSLIAEVTCLQCGQVNTPGNEFCGKCGRPLVKPTPPPSAPPPPSPVPTSFAGGRYQVKKFLGEGGRKRVYLVHDTTLDRDVAFALMKNEGLDALCLEYYHMVL